MINIKVEPQHAQSSMMLNLSDKSKGFLRKCRAHQTHDRKKFEKISRKFLVDTANK